VPASFTLHARRHEALQVEILTKALADAHPGIRRHAIRLCEPRLAKSPSLGELIVKLADDADPQVRLQLAYTLGEWDDPAPVRFSGSSP